jgi:hypothetical protein
MFGKANINSLVRYQTILILIPTPTVVMRKSTLAKPILNTFVERIHAAFRGRDFQSLAFRTRLCHFRDHFGDIT